MRSRFRHEHEHEHDHDRHDHDRDRGGRRDRGEFGGGRHGGPPHRGPRRTRRGDIRVAMLAGLTDGPAHGYELIQRLSNRTGGRWKPSPGSVYPTLQLLEEGGYVTSTQQDDKRVYAITEAGQAELQERLTDAGGPPPWMDSESAGGHGDLRKAIGQLVMAAKQVGMTDNATHIDAATGIVNEARRKLYQLLAEA